MWVPIVENNEIDTEGAEFFIKRNILNILQKDKDLDTLILGCTHYPLLLKVIKKYIPENITILEQGHIVSEKLIDYLQRHPEIDRRISRNRTIVYQTTESAKIFEKKSALFIGQNVRAEKIRL